MSQLILDEQLDSGRVFEPLQRWITVQRLQDLRSTERILDDRVPEILLRLRRPTFVTIDKGFWHSRWCNPGYCILYFALRDDEQTLLPGLLRALLRRKEFRSRASRMGKVVRVGMAGIDYWAFSQSTLYRIPRQEKRRRRK